MYRHSATSRWLQRCLHGFVLLSLLLSPLQSVAAHSMPPATIPQPAPVEPAFPSIGLFRTTVTVRGPAVGSWPAGEAGRGGAGGGRGGESHGA